MPEEVPGATVTVPFVFNVNPAGGVPTVVSITCAGVTTIPFRVSFAKTVAVVPPVVPFIGVPV